jgi:hypothetical protein
MVSRVLETGGNSKAKLNTKVYYLYTCVISLLIAIFIIFKGSWFISIFTQNEKISINLLTCLRIYIINCIPELLYLSTATLLKLNKK